MAKKATTKKKETVVSVASVDVTSQAGESFVQQVQRAKEQGLEGSVKVLNIPTTTTNNKPLLIKSSSIETKRAVSSFQERRKKMKK